MSCESRDFAQKIDRQRVSPNPMFDYAYLSFRSNLETFKEFSDMVLSDAKVLDAGCGFKPWRVFFSPSARYTGIDYSPLWSSPDVVGSIDFLPFETNSFDAIICSEVLEHTRDPAQCILELKRVCKPGGLIYISTPFCFPEHGIPHDYQRLTQYYYMTAFQADTIIRLRPTSSTLGSAFTAFNFFIECTPLRFAWGFKHLFYLLFNLAGLFCDKTIEILAPKLMRTLIVYTHMLPLGYNMIIRVHK